MFTLWTVVLEKFAGNGCEILGFQICMAISPGNSN